MRYSIFICLLFCISFFTCIKAQEKVDNYSFFKLCVTNDKDEVLLIGGEDWWEVTGSRYNQPISVSEFVKWMGKRMGVEIENVRLRGVFTFFYDWHKYKRPTLMQYYTADYKSGEPIVPDGCQYIKWVARKDLKEYIPYNEMVMILDKLNQNNDLVGGSFLIEKTEDGRRKGKLIEDFYNLN